MFQPYVLIIRRSKLHYTASAIITPIGGCPVQRLRGPILSQPVHSTATYRCDDTRGYVMQFWPPDDEHMCSKHVEAWNKLTVKQKFCASSLLIAEINILRCTVSKTLKKKKIMKMSIHIICNLLLILIPEVLVLCLIHSHVPCQC